MAIKVLDKNIKETTARIVSIIYSYSTKQPYNEIYRFIKYNMKTDKGFKSMVALGKKHAKGVNNKKIQTLLSQLLVCEELYFAERKRG